jgi:hypothetical protein
VSSKNSAEAIIKDAWVRIAYITVKRNPRNRILTVMFNVYFGEGLKPGMISGMVI